MRAVWEIEDYFPPSAWLAPMLRALTAIDEVYLRAHPDTPMLYQAGIRYRKDPSNQELWWDIPRIRRERFADCKKLAAWRAAELKVRFGTEAVALPVLQTITAQGGQEVVLVHVIVQFPDGTTEDPSRLLGM